MLLPLKYDYSRSRVQRKLPSSRMSLFGSCLLLPMQVRLRLCLTLPERPTVQRHPFKALYYLVSEPRSVRLTYAAIYLCLMGAGAALLLDAPTTFTASVDSIVAVGCGSFAFVGGLFGAVFSVTRFSAWERVGTVLVTTALSAYLLTSLWAQFFTAESGNRIPTAYLIGALLLVFIMRWRALRKAEKLLDD